MYRAILLAASLLVGSSTAGVTPSASEERPAAAADSATSSSSDTIQEQQALRRLTVALGDGETWSSFRHSVVDDAGHSLHAIPDMTCTLHENVSYVSCYGEAIKTKEDAERRFMRLVKELQTILPPESWEAAEIEPRIGSIRSYTAEEQDSHAQIDLDIALRWLSKDEVSYVITIFGWPAIGPQL